MTGSKRNSKKYQDLLRVGKALFWKHGISRVSVAEICEAAGVSKMTFYRSFDNKFSLAKAVLQERMEQGFAQFHELYEQDIPFEKKMEEIIRLKHENAKQISEELLKDIYKSPNEELQQWILRQGQRSMQDFRAFLERAQEAGELRQSLNLEMVMFAMEQLRGWVSHPQLMHLYPDPQTRITEMTRFIIYGLHQPPTDSLES